MGIGLIVVLLAWVTGKALGVSAGFGTMCSMVSGLSYFRKKLFTDRWRLWFIVGIPIGGFISTFLAGDLNLKFQMGIFDATFGDSLVIKAVTLLVGGFLIGFGARWAGG
jgi:hypothetical protein